MTQNSELMTLNKFLAYAGFASRRKAADLIKSRVVTVNHGVVTDPGYRVKPKDVIRVKGKTVARQAYIYVLFNKPRGAISTASDEKGRTSVLDFIDVGRTRIYPVGRLDTNTTGLLLLTNDGELAQRLTHPKHEVRKTYHVVLHKPISPEDIELIRKGVRLSDGVVRVDDIRFMPKAPKTCLSMVLHSGKNRIIRRLMEYLGYFIEKLDRVAYAGLTKRSLSAGQWRQLTALELSKLKKAAGLT